MKFFKQFLIYVVELVVELMKLFAPATDYETAAMAEMFERY